MSSGKNDATVALIDPVARLKVSNSARVALIRKFQRVEGNDDCCASAYNKVCQQFECLWRDECLTMAGLSEARG